MRKDVLPFVRSEVASVLARSPHLLETTTPLIEYGLDSMRALDIVVAMENEFDLEIEDEEVADLRTIDDIVDCISRKMSDG